MSGDGSFNIFDRLREWSAELENWQKLALLKLLEKDVLDSADYEVIYTEFKINKNLSPAPADCVNFDLNASSIPQPIEQSQRLCLSAIKDVKGVNAITEGQVLQCGPKLTVVFGVNGSGKSGYARILKAACFTRSSDTTIHGNVNLPRNQRNPASANFVFADGTSVAFNHGVRCPQLRDNFAVFDTSCIRICVDDKNEFMVNPYGFDVFQGMVEVTAKTKKMLEDEVLLRTPNLVPFRLEGSSSPVAALLNDLSKNTDLAVLKKLGVFGVAEEGRLSLLRTELSELATKDKSIVLSEKRRCGRDIKGLTKKLREMSVVLQSDAYLKGEASLVEIKRLRDVATAASSAQFSKEPVQPIGTEAWRALIEAAIEFNAEAFPGRPFPLDSETTRCLLCQQPIDKDAKQRLEKFFVYIRSEAESNLKKGVELAGKLEKTIAKVDFDFFRQDAAGYRAVESSTPTVVQDIKEYIGSVKSLRDAIVESLKSGNWNLPTVPTTSSISTCTDIRNQLAKEIRLLRTQDISKRKKQLEDEIQLLCDRRHLSGILASVETSIENLKWIEKTQEAKRALTPQRITVKQKALMTELMGKGFKEKFDDECKNLGLNSAPIKINISGSEAITRRNLTVGRDDGPQPEPSHVLSEGEQTAVAMADFLTEIGLGDTPVGIIFDDPVNSMDHLRKEKIAQRLVQEASKRQVVIFTHDVLFTHYLAEEAENLGVEKVQFKACTVSVGIDKAPGHIDKEVFPHVHYEDESDKLTLEHLNSAKQLSGDDQMDKLKLGIGTLRTACENFIQKKIFNDVVRRWRENMKVTNLTEMFWSSELATAVAEQFARLSRYLEGHSHSPEYHEVPLGVEILERELSAFQETKRRYNAEKKKHESALESKKAVFS